LIQEPPREFACGNAGFGDVGRLTIRTKRRSLDVRVNEVDNVSRFQGHVVSFIAWVLPIFNVSFGKTCFDRVSSSYPLKLDRLLFPESYSSQSFPWDKHPTP
jgi:hypothetical protein